MSSPVAEVQKRPEGSIVDLCEDQQYTVPYSTPCGIWDTGQSGIATMLGRPAVKHLVEYWGSSVRLIAASSVINGLTNSLECDPQD